MLKLCLFSHKVCSRTFIINSSSTHYDKVASSCSHWERTYSSAFLCKIRLRGTNRSRSSFLSRAPRAQYFAFLKPLSNADRLASKSLIHRQPGSGEAKTNIAARSRAAQLTPVAARELAKGTANLPESRTRQKCLLGGTSVQFKLFLFCSKRQKMCLLNPTHLKTHFCTFVTHAIWFYSP